MTGGTWTSQNKIRPGAYINFRSKRNDNVMVGERGIVTLPLILSWGPEKQIIELKANEDLNDTLGIDMTDSTVKLVREAFKRASTLLLYRLNTGVKATATLENLIITAKYSGTKGNNITIIIQNNIEDSTLLEVITTFENRQVDKQIVKTIPELKINKYVEFKGTGGLKATAGIGLKGGTDGTSTTGDYTDYFKAIELYEFNTMGVPTKDQSIKAIATNFIKRLREYEGKKVQVVLENYPEADYEGVISVKNGVMLKDGVITSDEAVAFVAGATGGANVNKSLTYSTYDGAIDVDKRYTNREIEAALKNGEIVFTISNGKVVIEQDINTFKSFTEEKNKEFRKNRVLRTLDAINNDIKLLWGTSYIGKGDNNIDGRNLFKKDVIKLLETYKGMNTIENVVPEDVEINQGNDKDSVITKVAAQPVDAMEKLYMNVEVR